MIYPSSSWVKIRFLGILFFSPVSLHILRCRLPDSLRELDVLHFGDFLDPLPLFGREIDVDSDVFHTLTIHQFLVALPKNLLKSLDIATQLRYDESMVKLCRLGLE